MMPNTPFAELTRPTRSQYRGDGADEFLRLERPGNPVLAPPRAANGHDRRRRTRFGAALTALFAAFTARVR